MTLESNQPLREMSTRSISWGKGGRYVRPTTYHHPVPLSRNLGTLTSCNPLGHSRPVTGLIYLLPCTYTVSFWTKLNWVNGKLTLLRWISPRKTINFSIIFFFLSIFSLFLLLFLLHHSIYYCASHALPPPPPVPPPPPSPPENPFPQKKLYPKLKRHYW